MGPVAQVVSSGAVLALACAVVALCAGVAAAVVLTKRARRRREALDAALARSRDEVESLCRKVDELSDEVVRARRAAERDQEYVITSLGSDEPAELVARGSGTARQPVGRLVEEQLVQALARQPRTSTMRRAAVDVAVRVVALGHGARRALSADVLDRAAAEAHVARRRSRRERKRQVRAARRVVRAERPTDQEVA